MVPLPTFDSSDIVAMSSNLVIQLPEDQFLHWHQDMEKKQEEQARQMRELQDCAEHLQRENDRLRAQETKDTILVKETCKIAGKQSTRPNATRERSLSFLMMQIP